MHEFSLCHTLVEKLLEEAEKLTPPSVRVTKTVLACGRLRQIVPEYLQAAYEALTQGTVAENSVLEIREIPVAGRCTACGREGELDMSEGFICPKCAAPVFEMISGRELFLEQMEIEQDETD